ncbi:MAG: IS1182 family transposase, partial [bacterium]|nr:IS1182 family transposase [bacterium]
MQGKKQYQEKLFNSFRLSERVPKHNFYRCLKEELDLNFLYKLTRKYYGECGQKSIDPVVFFKLSLVGYLENIDSDRKLINHCSMRLDILYFIGYDLDEELPWHSTLSRTRQLFPEDIFQQVFQRVLLMCVEKGMVSGHTQCIDSAPVKANASMDSLELKVPEESLEDHLRKVRYMSSQDRKVSQDKATEDQRKITASDRQLKEIQSRNKKWKKDQDQRPGSDRKNAKYTSNHTHYSPSDPDARISVKPGKARKLNYLSQMAVDTAHHVITHIQADFANKKDSQCLQNITLDLNQNLDSLGLKWINLVADTGYSSGENYAFLEQLGLQAYIPAHGTYKGGPEGFTYHKEGDYWLCRNQKRVTFRKIKIEAGKNNNKKRQYFTKRSDCKGCPFKTECIGKSHERRIEITIYKDEYDRAIKKVNSVYGKKMKTVRQSTVEPVFGTLTQFLAMRKVNTRGIHQANKVMLMAAIAYNLKKYLRFNKGKVLEMIGEAFPVFILKTNL